MTPVELIALSLGLSIAVAAACGLAAAALERFSADPNIRDRAWAWAFYLPALPPVAVAVSLLTPAPVRSVALLQVQSSSAPLVGAAPVAVAPTTPIFTLDMGQVAVGLLLLAGLLVAARLTSLGLRAWRLHRLVARTAPAPFETHRVVADSAARLKVASPDIRTGSAATDALLTGLTRPVLILPQNLAEAPDTPAARAVITHELAHLKRGDHRAVWIEEAVIALLAVNPVLPLIRARRAAAREEACDALALTGAEPAARRAYAQSLIEALRARTDSTTLPALTFNGTPRSQAMRRLKSILTPPAAAGRDMRLIAAAAGLGILGLAAAATAAVASQRAVEVTWAEQDGKQVADDADATAQAAARQAAAAARAALSPEQRERFRDPSVADYRRICASDEPGDDGFCSGVIFSQLDGPDVCAPSAIDDPDRAISGPALGTVVDRTMAQFDAIPASSARSPMELAQAALQRAYPCRSAQADLDFGSVAMEAESMSRLPPEAQAALPAPAPGLARLWLSLDAEAVTPVEGDTLVVSLHGEAGERWLAKTTSHVITPAGVPDTMVLDLEADYFPSIGAANRSYILQARVERGGQTLSEAAPASVRLAAGSQEMLSRMRPELRLVPVGR